MDDIALGPRVRTVRIRLHLRQSDVAGRAGTSQDTISKIELDRIARLQVATVRRALAALEMELRLDATWRGGELDRLMDEDHALLAGVAAGLLVRLGSAPNAEVSFAVYGERRSIDLLAWHAPTRTLLVIEVKTRLYAVEETLRVHDKKMRAGCTDRRGAVRVEADSDGAAAGVAGCVDAASAGGASCRQLQSRVPGSRCRSPRLAGQPAGRRQLADLPLWYARGAW